MIFAGLHNRHIHNIHTLSTFTTAKIMPHYYGAFFIINISNSRHAQCSILIFHYNFLKTNAMKTSDLNEAAKMQAINDIMSSGSMPLIKYDKYIKSEKLNNPGFKRSKIK